jgi:hypothetical protein
MYSRLTFTDESLIWGRNQTLAIVWSGNLSRSRTSHACLFDSRCRDDIEISTTEQQSATISFSVLLWSEFTGFMTRIKERKPDSRRGKWLRLVKDQWISRIESFSNGCQCMMRHKDESVFYNINIRNLLLLNLGPWLFLESWELNRWQIWIHTPEKSDNFINKNHHHL